MTKQDILGLLKKSYYFGTFLPFSHLFISLFGKRLSPKLITKIEDKRNNLISKILLPFVKLALKEIEENPNNFKNFSNFEQSDNFTSPLSSLSSLTSSSSHSSFLIPHSSYPPIWLFWLQGESSIPPLSRLCIETIHKNSNGHSLILLTKDNLSEYVNIPTIIYKRFEEGNIKHAHFADLVRINLLAQQGGLWLDATMLLTSPIPEETFQRDFWTIKTKPFGNFVSQCRWSVFTLAAKKNNPLFVALSKIFEEYFKKYPVMIDYFMFDHLINLIDEESPEIRKMIDDVPFNNPEVHALNPILGKPFNEKEWQSLTKDTFLFKLSNKTYPPSFPFPPNSFFSHLKKITSQEGKKI